MPAAAEQRAISTSATVAEVPVVVREMQSWVACDKCEKWRRLNEGSLAQYQDKAFHCSELPGVDCDTPEEAYNDTLESGAQNKLLIKRGKTTICPTCHLELDLNKKKARVVLEVVRETDRHNKRASGRASERQRRCVCVYVHKVLSDPPPSVRAQKYSETLRVLCAWCAPSHAQKRSCLF